MNLNKTKMKNLTAFACSVLLSGGLFAQYNLVENGSFENSSGKVKRIGSISSCEGWASATGVKADYFLPSKEAVIGTPENVYGNEVPKDGSCYAGIVAYSYGDKMPRSYITTRLNENLKKGKKYCASYSVSLAESSKYAVNQMGMLFSKKEYESDAKTSIIEPKAQIKSDKIYNAQYGWHQVCGVFIAEGGEKYLTIGNFNATQDIKNEKNKPEKGVKITQIIAAYYYIDNVVVYEMDENTPCDCQTVEAEEQYSTLIYQKQILIDEAKNSPKQVIDGQEIFFGFGQDALTPLSKTSLDVIVRMMMANPKLRLQINGHSDALEDKVGNEKSEYSNMDNKRIAAVMDYLKEKGVASERLIPSAQGSEMPNPEGSDSDDEEVRQAKERRVTFIAR